MNLEGIDHIAMSVADVSRSLAWYVDVLGFERRYEGAWDDIPIFIGKGTTAIALFPITSNGPGSKAEANGPRFLHLAFRADAKEFQIARRELHERAIEFHFEDHGIAHSIYFKDLDGHKLEITT